VSTTPDDGIESDLGHPESSAPKRSSLRAVMVVTAVLLVLLVVAAVFAVSEFRQHQQLQATDDDRSSAINTAQQFALRMDTFDGAKLSDYEAKVNTMLTTRAKGEFKQSFPAFEKVYQQGKAVGSGTVRAAGVENIDQDSATVLVIHDRLVKSSFGDQQQYLRWSVQLDKVGGTWKIDKFEDGS
jgi:Mce-associated membrane protein